MTSIPAILLNQTHRPMRVFVKDRAAHDDCGKAILTGNDGDVEQAPASLYQRRFIDQQGHHGVGHVQRPPRSTLGAQLNHVIGRLILADQLHRPANALGEHRPRHRAGDTCLAAYVCKINQVADQFDPRHILADEHHSATHIHLRNPSRPTERTESDAICINVQVYNELILRTADLLRWRIA